MDSKADNSKSKQQIKNIILYATVAVLVSSALLAIFMIFFGDIETLLQVFCTLAIIYVEARLCSSLDGSQLVLGHSLDFNYLGMLCRL